MMTYIIYLAAGNSRRFGSNKLMYELNHLSLYQHGLKQIEMLISKRTDCQCIVVSQYKEILNEVKHSIECKEAISGMSYSIKAGINAIENLQEEDYIMFVVADQPYIKMDTLNKLIEKAYQTYAPVLSVKYLNRLGNPVLFRGDLVFDLLSLEEDQGGRVVFNNYLKLAKYVEVSSENELIDFDTEEDIDKHLSKIGGLGYKLSNIV